MNETTIVALVVNAAAWLFSAGIMFATVRTLTKGQEAIFEILKKQAEHLGEHGERLARIESKCRAIHGHGESR